jgi:hypothetical protein
VAAWSASTGLCLAQCTQGPLNTLRRVREETGVLQSPCFCSIISRPVRTPAELRFVASCHIPSSTGRSQPGGQLTPRSFSRYSHHSSTTRRRPWTNVADRSSSLELSVAIKSTGGLYMNVIPALSKPYLALRKRANIRYARLKATDTESEDNAP